MLPMLWVRVNGRSVLYVRQGHCHGLPQMEAREKGGGSVTEMALNGTPKYRISSDPPLNSCIDRLFGKVYDKCVSGGVKDCFYVHTVVKREITLLPLHPGRSPAQSERGCGLERGCG